MRRLFKSNKKPPNKKEEYEENKKTVPNRYSSQETIVHTSPPLRQNDSTETVKAANFHTAQTSGFTFFKPNVPNQYNKRDVIVPHFGVNDKYSRPEISIYRGQTYSAPNTAILAGLPPAQGQKNRVVRSEDLLPIWYQRTGNNSSNWMDGSTNYNRRFVPSNQVGAFAPDVVVENMANQEKRRRGIHDLDPYSNEDLISRKKVVEIDSKSNLIHQAEDSSRGYNTVNVFKTHPNQGRRNNSTGNIISNQTKEVPKKSPNVIFYVRSPPSPTDNHQKLNSLPQTSYLPQDLGRPSQIPFKFERDTQLYVAQTSHHSHRTPGHHKESSTHHHQDRRYPPPAPPVQPQRSKRPGSKDKSPPRHHHSPSNTPKKFVQPGAHSTPKPSYVRVNHPNTMPASGGGPATISKHSSRHDGSSKEKKRKKHCKCKTENCKCKSLACDKRDKKHCKCKTENCKCKSPVCDKRDKSLQLEARSNIAPVHKSSVINEKELKNHVYPQDSCPPPKSTTCRRPTSLTRTTASCGRQKSPVKSSQSPKRPQTPVKATQSPQRHQPPVKATQTPEIHQSPVKAKQSPQRHQPPVKATQTPQRDQPPVKATQSPHIYESPIKVTQAPPRYESSRKPPQIQAKPTPPVREACSDQFPVAPPRQEICPQPKKQAEPPSILKHQAAPLPMKHSSLDFIPIWYQQRGRTSSEWLDGGTYYNKIHDPANQVGAFASKVNVEEMVKKEKRRRNINDVMPYSNESLQKKHINKGSRQPARNARTRDGNSPDYSVRMLEANQPLTWNYNVKQPASSHYLTSYNNTDQSPVSPFFYDNDSPYHHSPALASPSSAYPLSSVSSGPATSNNAFDFQAYRAAVNYNQPCNCVKEDCQCKIKLSASRNRIVKALPTDPCNCVTENCQCKIKTCASRNRTVKELTKDKCIDPATMSACSMGRGDSRSRRRPKQLPAKASDYSIERSRSGIFGRRHSSTGTLNEECYCKTEDCYCTYEPCASRERSKRKPRLRQKPKPERQYKRAKAKSVDNDKCVLCRVDAIERPFNWCMRTFCITWVWNDREFARHCGRDLGPLPEYNDKPPSLGNSVIQRWWNKRFTFEDDEVI